MTADIHVRPPRTSGLIFDPPAADERIDWSSWYLEAEDDMGESGRHFEIIQVVLSALRLFLTGSSLRVGSDQFFAWLEDEPLVRVSPDVYVIPWPDQPLPDSWQTWRPEHPAPVFALEVVSEDWRKDYDVVPAKYAQLGVRELLIFDPDAANAPPGSKRVALQIWRRSTDGSFTRFERSDELVDVRSLHLFAIRRGEHLRFSEDRLGERLLLTEAERAATEAQRAVIEAERAATEAERAAAEAERAAAEAQRADAATQRAAQAEARAARLAEKLAALGVSVDDDE